MRYGREEPTTVYRVVYREPGGEWQQWATYNSNTGRPYISKSSAQGIATNNSQLPFYRDKGYEWGVQSSELNWEMA